MTYDVEPFHTLRKLFQTNLGDIHFMVGIESSDSLFIYPSVYLFNKYLLNIFYGPGTVLGPYVNETDAIGNSQKF